MLKRCLTVALMMLCCRVAVAGGDGVRLIYDAGGTPVTVTRDGKGTVQFDGLPYPGIVLYRPATQVVYYQHPAEPLWLTVEAGQVPVVEAKLVQGPVWQPWQDKPTRRWDVSAKGETCDQWFASPTAAAQAGLTVGDLLRVMTALEWLNGGGQGTPCNRLGVSPQQAAQVGLPLRWTTPASPWQLTELVRTRMADITLPVTVKPVDEETRLALLLSQFTPEERQAFLKSNGKLPVAQQILAIEGALAGAVMP